MTTTRVEQEVVRFRTAISRELGLRFDDSKLGFLEEVLHGRLSVRGMPPAAYLDRLNQAPKRWDEWRVLAQKLTVGETYFFRHMDQFQAFADVVLPNRLAAVASSRRLRILSAGCASGDEAYSLAILVRERLGDRAADVNVQAVDLNPANLDRARRAQYSDWALRETPDEIRHRWFHNNGRDFILDETIRRAVVFEERNLMDANADLWKPDTYDVVFCRNMLMYFSPEAAQALVHHMIRSLRPGGYLFLGHAETLRGLSHDVWLLHTHETFYYQRKNVVGYVESATSTEAPVLHAVGTVSPADTGWTTTWIDTVQRATDRIHALVKGRTSIAEISPVGETCVASPSLGIEIGMVMELLKKERFLEALNLLNELSPESPHDPDVLLLRATLLAHNGQLGLAEKVCSELLDLDSLNAGAHYLLALCREGVGDVRGALDHDQMATYLDPDFAMPRFHLGLMEKRAGETDVALRDLQQALHLLMREDASRLLLFGGGFGRGALMAICHTEIHATGVKP